MKTEPGSTDGEGRILTTELCHTDKLAMSHVDLSSCVVSNSTSCAVDWVVLNGSWVGALDRCCLVTVS